MNGNYITDNTYWVIGTDYDPTYTIPNGVLEVRAYLNDCCPNVISALHSEPFGVGLVEHEFWELAGDGIGDEYDVIERYNTLEEAENRIKTVMSQYE